MSLFYGFDLFKCHSTSWGNTLQSTKEYCFGYIFRPAMFGIPFFAVFSWTNIRNGAFTLQLKHQLRSKLEVGTITCFFQDIRTVLRHRKYFEMKLKKCKTLKSTFSFGPNINFSVDGFYDSSTKVEDCRKIRSKRGLLSNEDGKLTRLSFSYIPATTFADCGKHVHTYVRKLNCM